LIRGSFGDGGASRGRPSGMKDGQEELEMPGSPARLLVAFATVVMLPTAIPATTLAMKSPASRPAAGEDLPPQVARLLGTWVGEWQMWGVDAAGAVAPRMKWTDRMTASEPVRSADRIAFKTVDEMTFEGVPGPPRTWVGSKGWRLNGDETLGAHYIESFGRESVLVSLRADAESYIEDAAPQELAQLGCPAGTTGSHVLVKVVVDEAEGETHRITRVTTVRWPTADGDERHRQFVSLQGYHRKLD
jgi:hypothetical protein